MHYGSFLLSLVIVYVVRYVVDPIPLPHFLHRLCSMTRSQSLAFVISITISISMSLFSPWSLFIFRLYSFRLSVVRPLSPSRQLYVPLCRRPYAVYSFRYSFVFPLPPCLSHVDIVVDHRSHSHCHSLTLSLSISVHGRSLA